jgi:hypothetical protein
MSLIMPYVKAGLDIGIKAEKSVMTEAIPLCLMSGYERCVAERIIPDTRISDYKHMIDDFTVVRQNEGKAKGPGCASCRLCGSCEGPWKEYPELFGWDEFTPVRGDA